MIFLDLMSFYFYIEMRRKELARMGSYHRADGQRPRQRKVSERSKKYE